MRVARTEDKAKPIVEGLQEVAGFLNAVSAETTQHHWRHYLKTWLKQHGPIFPFFSLATNLLTRRRRTVPALTLEAAKDLRWWMHNDLGFVRSAKPLARPFEALVYRLNELKLEMGWQSDAVTQDFKRFNPSQAIVNIRWDDGTVGRWATISWPITKTPKDHFYAILGKALETGDLTRLKVCRWCKKYIVAVKDRKLDFCPGTTCKDSFHNHEKGDTGYHKERRRKRREQQLQDARKLVKTGAPFAKITAATGLPQRAIERLLEEDQ